MYYIVVLRRLLLIVAGLLVAMPALGRAPIQTRVPGRYPGKFKAVVQTAVAPVVGWTEERLGYRYGVTPYVAEVEGASRGRGAVVRMSRPSSFATDVKELEHVGFLRRRTNPRANAEGYEFVFRAQKVNVIVDLRREGKSSTARHYAEKFGGEYHNVAMSDNAWFNPLDTLVGAVSIVNRASTEGKKVAVHCEAGRGRTGMVIAAYHALRVHHESPSALNENEVIAYARANGLELLGQEHAVRMFVRGLESGAIQERDDGTVTLRAAPRTMPPVKHPAMAS